MIDPAEHHYSRELGANAYRRAHAAWAKGDMRGAAIAFETAAEAYANGGYRHSAVNCWRHARRLRAIAFLPAEA